VTDSSRGADAMPDPWRWFARTFGIAVIAHLAGNPPSARSGDFAGSTALIVVSTVLGLLAVLLVARPERRTLGATATLVLLSVWLEAPFLSNHWLLVGFVAAAVVVSLSLRDPWAWFSVTGRWVLLAFYSFAAFAKLNTGFLDPVASCGVFYANQSLGSFGLPTFPTDSPIAWLTIAGPMLTELSVPLLLAFSRTRRIGVLVALTFHTVISLDLDQHFYDFTAALVMLLCLFLPEPTMAALEASATRRPRIVAVGLAISLLLVVAAVLPQVVLTSTILGVLPFVAWVPFAGWLIVSVARGGLGPSHVPMRMPGALAYVLVAGVVANGLTPYLELKTAYGFNMYANLVSVDGESNHLVVRRTLPLTDVQEHLLSVVRTDDAELGRYAEDGYLIPERNLLDYLARHPSTSVVVSDDDGERTLDGGDAARLPLLVEKFQLFRAVDGQDPPRCQANWLPAR
jgi:hypothetical protein